MMRNEEIKKKAKIPRWKEKINELVKHCIRTYIYIYKYMYVVRSIFIKLMVEKYRLGIVEKNVPNIRKYKNK